VIALVSEAQHTIRDCGNSI